MIKLDEISYELSENINNCFDIEKVTNLYTDYFHDFDYIVGDIAYDKIRLKGFYDDKKNNQNNDIKNVEKYLKTECAYQCNYFILKKLK